MKNLILFLVYLAYLLIMSFAAIILYHKDKKMAEKNGNEVRIKEKTLLSVACIGGAIGSLIGRIMFHHKTNKAYFSFIIYLSLILQVGVGALLAYFYIMG